MKFIYLTDVHIKGVNPGRRKDTYFLSILGKLQELKPVIKDEEIDCVIIGGDLFDSPDISNNLYSQVAKTLRSWGVKIFVVPGNHDVFGQNIDTLQHTSLGALASSGVVTILDRKTSPLRLLKKDVEGAPMVAITGQEYYNDIDKGDSTDYSIEPSNADIQVLVVHSMLLEKPFHPDVDYTLMSSVVSDADLILSGHYHPDSIDTTYNGIRFVKPRATGRPDASLHNIKHKPNYAIVDLTSGEIEVEFRDYQSAKPGIEVFDVKNIVDEKEKTSKLKAMSETIRNIRIHDTTSIDKILDGLGESEDIVSDELLTSVREKIADAERSLSDTSLDGFLPSNQRIDINKVELHNFQLHSDTVVDFVSGKLNALIGESDTGKTSILRAIKWVLYNEPKGTGFITNGEKECWVRITFSNGYKVKRQRTDYSSGYYEIYDPNTGETEKYTGFGHSIPREVYNAHQMPKVTLGKESVSFNIAEQLEGPFMLSKSPEERATFIGKIIGVESVDKAISEVSKKTLSLNKETKSLKEDLEVIEEDIKSLDHLGDLKKDIDDITKVLSDIKDIENLLEYVNTVSSKLEEIEANMIPLKERLKHLEGLPELKEFISSIDGTYNNYITYNRLIENISKTDKAIELESNKLSKLKYVNELPLITSELSAFLNRRDKIISFIKKRDQIDYEIKRSKSNLSSIRFVDEEFIEEIVELNDTLRSVKSISQKSVTIDEKETKTKKRIEYCNNKMAEYNSDYKEILSQLGECPICFNKIDGECIKTIELGGS